MLRVSRCKYYHQKFPSSKHYKIQKWFLQRHRYYIKKPTNNGTSGSSVVLRPKKRSQYVAAEAATKNSSEISEIGTHLTGNFLPSFLSAVKRVSMHHCLLSFLPSFKSCMISNNVQAGKSQTCHPLLHIRPRLPSYTYDPAAPPHATHFLSIFFFLKHI